jgi:ribosomal protein L15E
MVETRRVQWPRAVHYSLDIRLSRNRRRVNAMKKPMPMGKEKMDPMKAKKGMAMKAAAKKMAGKKMMAMKAMKGK